MEKKIFILSIIVVVLLGGNIFLGNNYIKLVSPARGGAQLVTSVAARPHPAAPSGKQTYEIVKKDSPGPKIIQATIDPPDVHVGDTQKLEVVVSSPDAIKSVTAFIETDNGTTTLVLSPIGTVQASRLPPKKYAVDSDGHVVSAGSIAQNNSNGDSGNIISRLAGAIFGDSHITSAALSSSRTNYKYQGSWVVHDTHNIYYNTTFVVSDVSGAEDSVTLAWSDACGIPQSGNWTIGAACTISSLDGVDRGNATITNYTLTLNAQFAFTPGYSITIGSGGSIAIGSGSLSQGYLSYTDADVDNYPLTTVLNFSASSPSAPYVLRGNEIHYSQVDCNDNSALVWQNLTGYHDNDGDGYGNPVGGGSVCSGASLPAGYVLNSTDCNDGNSYIYQTLSTAADVDQDGYIQGSSFGSACVGFASSVNGRNYYRDSSGNYTQLTNGSQLGAADCNDSNNHVQVNKVAYADNDGDGYTVAGAAQCVSSAACGSNSWYSYDASNNCSVLTSAKSGVDCYDSSALAHPGASTFALVNRGDGSFDYNCDGSQTSYWPTGKSNCIAEPDSVCTSQGLTGTSGACQKGQEFYGFIPGVNRSDYYAGWHQSYTVPACGQSQYMMWYGMPPGNGLNCGTASNGTRWCCDGNWCYGFYLCDVNSFTASYCN